MLPSPPSGVGASCEKPTRCLLALTRPRAPTAKRTVAAPTVTPEGSLGRLVGDSLREGMAPVPFIRVLALGALGKRLTQMTLY